MRSLLLSGALLVACGGGAPPDTTPIDWGKDRVKIQRLAVERDGPPSAEDVIALQLKAPESVEDWSCDAEEAEILGQGELRGLNVRGKRRAQISIPGDYAPGEFNIVAVHVHASSTMTLRLGLQSEDATLGSPDLHHVFKNTIDVYEFDMRALDGASEPFEELILLGNSGSRGNTDVEWTLLSVSFLRRTPDRWLPLAGQPPTLIDLDGETRRGTGLAAGTPITTRVAVPNSGGVLRFGLAPTPRLAQEAPAQVTVRVDGKVARECSVPESGWRSETVDLSGQAGSEVLVSFELAEGPVNLVALEQPVLTPAEGPAPLVLLITSDTHRGAYLGSAQQGIDVVSPNLDALAARGVLFEKCFSNSDNTLPAHVTLMTGRDPAETGVVSNQHRLAENAETLAEHFAAAGYATYAVTSAVHMNDPWSGLGQGFDRFDYPLGDREQRAPATLDIVESWMADAAGTPLFLWVHLFDAHRPYNPAEAETRRYYGAGDPYDMELPEPYWPTPGQLRGIRDKAWVEALYRAQVTELDEDLERLLDHPRVQQGLVVFTSDHGESLGEQGIWWVHHGVYPSVLHVPLILAWPEAPSGTRISERVRQCDIARSVLALAGLDGSALAGEDLAPHWRGEEPGEVPNFALASEGRAASLTLGRWHLVINLGMSDPVNYTNNLPKYQPVGLFDLSQDPMARHDLSAKEPDVMVRLGGALLRWLESAPAAYSERNALDESSAAMLNALGYATSEEESVELANMDKVRRLLQPWLGD